MAMARRRTYGDRCGVARALDVVGERWSLLVIRELLLGAKRFTDLRAGLPHLSPDVLSQRLRELEAAGVVTRRTLGPPAGARVYELTARGQELEPVVLALGRWGSAAPFPEGDAGMGADALAIALKTLFAPAAADGFEGSVELRLDGDTFAAEVAEGRLRLVRGPLAAPGAVITAAPGPLAAVLWHGRALAGAEAAGEVAVAGDRAAAERFLELFPLPERAAA
jgi:DNA-binding HxlR family transcriptional regulator